MDVENGGNVILQKDDGRLVRWQPGEWGAAKSSAYTVAERDLNVGERIVWTRKDAATRRQRPAARHDRQYSS